MYLAVSKLAKKIIDTLLAATVDHINIIRKHDIKVTSCRVDRVSALSTQ